MLIQEKLPKNARIHTSSKDLIIRLALQFLNTVSAKANDICNERNKKTVCSDHVLDALYKMNLGHYMAKIADPKMSAKREKTFLKQKSAKQKSEVMARL
jgi:histone H3/H4